jgi:predicted Zn-dependent protease
VNRAQTHRTGTYLARAGLSVALTLLAAGCANVAEIGTMAAQQAGVLTSSQADSIKRSAAATEKTFRDITPEQEYYIGRSVTATVLASYRPYDKPALNRYVNVVGQSVATHADRPQTFGGYRFLVIDTDEVNAFAAPGGLILVSKGMLRSTQNEDELAAVLAHEIGHVQNQDGLRAIKTGRINAALTVIAVEAGKNFGGQNLAEVTKAFEGSITDISNTLMNSGYSRGLEYQADASAVKILKRAGYNPQALVASLTKMQTQLAQDSRGFGKTHPSPQDRIDHLKPLVGTSTAAAAPPTRQQRYSAAMAGIN